ncbi:MAG: MBL fold metallo-hydrolase [Alphaproteobacteria bacterium]|nr:MBL fold metallo-hydrolase [Alphaproteobacteria bacterium]
MSKKTGLTRRAANRLLSTLPFLLAACAGSSERALAGKPDHHTAGGFRNPPGSPESGGGFGDWAGFFWRNTNRDGGTALPDDHVLPKDVVKAGLRTVDGDRLTWLGHASFLIRLAGKTIITDPFLSDHASPIPPFGPKRFAPPALRANELPPIDLLLLTHNHYDHLDLPSLDVLPLANGARAVLPLGLMGYAENRDFAEVIEMDWHGQIMIDGLQITALPAIHMSKRGFFDRNRTLWTSYALRGPGQSLYIAGDTAHGPVFKEMKSTFDDFDLGLVPIGAYEPRLLMQGVHATPEDAVQIGRDLGIKRLVAKHWGTIQLTDEPPFEPPGRFRTAARTAGYADEDVWVMKIGETRAI